MPLAPEQLAALQKHRAALADAVDELTDSLAALPTGHGHDVLLSLVESVDAFNAIAERPEFAGVLEAIEVPRLPDPDRDETLRQLEQFREFYSFLVTWHPKSRREAWGLLATAKLFLDARNEKTGEFGQVLPDDVPWLFHCLRELKDQKPRDNSAEIRESENANWWREGNEPREWNPEDDTDFDGEAAGSS